MSEKPSDTMNKAMALAVKAGIPCTGWTLQFDGAAYAAWLWDDSDGECQEPLVDSVECFETPEKAALDCLFSADMLGFS